MQPPTNNFSPPRRRKRGLGSLFFTVILLALAGTAAANRQNLLDWVELRNYVAPTAIVKLADQDTMTPVGRHIFYVNHPAVQTKAVFFSACPNSGGEKTIVLGCYHGNQRGIFLLGVADPRLNGVTQITAAHEMLHAAYDRLSSKDRQTVDTQLLDYYHHSLHDQRILDTIAAYKVSEPNDVVNEMHSVFGTEIGALPPQLEQYYARYFNDRSRVAAFAAQYQAEFTSRQTAVAQDDAQLAQLKTQIETAEANLKAGQANINTQQSQLLQSRNNGDVTAYNAGVPAYNGLIDAYNVQVKQVSRLIDQYNQLVVARNAIAFEEDQLINALSSETAAPVKQ